MRLQHSPFRQLLRFTWTVLSLVALIPQIALAEADIVAASQTDGTLTTLQSFVTLRQTMSSDIAKLRKELASAGSEAEKDALRQQLTGLESDLRTVTRNFENIAAGVDISSLRAQEEKAFNLQNELVALIKPAIDEMKDMTAKVRQKSDLKERIAYYEPRIKVLQSALDNAIALLAKEPDAAIAEQLRATIENWRKQLDLMQSELQATQLQLDKLVASETSLAAASHSYMKSFFEKRGLYLTIALLVVIGIMLLSKLAQRGMQRYLPGFRKPNRSFRIRLIELIQRVVSTLLMIIGPMVVFYIAEDWVLFSLGILLLIGLGWALRQAVPRYWHQMQIFLNIGSVREGERLTMDGLPWCVEQINVFSTLVNPVANLRQRVPLADLVNQKSRPSYPDEPWFPCRKGDWVILKDGVRGKVIGIAAEMVQLVERGGAMVTYAMADFLAGSPRNLATNFRLKETVGISYALQKDATNTIPDTLHRYIERRIEQEGYAAQLINLRVEFAQANNSSLDLVVIADFKGELGDLYNRLRRAIQRWSVDACTEYGWEIPFPQMTVHGVGTAE
ncbi:MAG: hypothetical protein KDI82_00915 [Gammaproteobacteria bacterium]|nr:hypothetical protein [Gammaproteobacteria bacterium]